MHKREGQVIACIFLAIAMGSQKEAIDFNGISMIADGINHAVPTQKELKNSIEFLLNKKLIIKEGIKYKLTKDGIIQYNFASLNTSIILNIWKNLEKQITK